MSTSCINVICFISQGYDHGRSRRQDYGAGIYSAPDPRVAECYAREFSHDGKTYLVMMQNRLNMAQTKLVKNVQVCKDVQGDYFVTSDEDSIRPYGILVKAK